ncbi:MAG: hypothetical protein NVS9B4_15530 [Candidatus Acidiferrum sp.]
MATKKEKKVQVREIAKKNNLVDEKVVSESLELIDYLRRVGVKPRGFNILRSSESRLKIKPPAVYKLRPT